MKRSGEEILVNHQIFQFCIHNQEEEIQHKKMDVANRTTEVARMTGDLNPEIPTIPTAQRPLSVGIVERLGTTKINAEVHQRTTRRRQRQMLLLPQEEMKR